MNGAFQSTHPHGVRLVCLGYESETGKISIHAPAWGATARLDSRSLSRRYFNPRTRMGRDQACLISDVLETLFQSTHPHGARQEPAELPKCPDAISIHAPGWGATAPAWGATIRRTISIHAPGWGATFRQISSKHLQSRFQSTHPGGVRPGGRQTRPGNRPISIHAPGWGATDTNECSD